MPEDKEGSPAERRRFLEELLAHFRLAGPPGEQKIVEMIEAELAKLPPAETGDSP